MKSAENIDKEEVEGVEEESGENSQEGEGLEAKVQELEQKLSDKNNDFLRLMAEFDNFRKRTQREKADLIEYAGTEVIKALLPVLDDFERSLSVMEKTDNVSSLKEGVSMIHDKFFKILIQKGLAPIPTEGEDFDSELHEAIATVPMGDEKAGKIIEEAERGYKLKDRVIRYSKVIVGE